MQLNRNQLEKMNAYVGCGPHLQADILIMGNEEGTDGYPGEIAAHAAVRFRLYGKDDAAVSELLGGMAQNNTFLYQDDLFHNEHYAFSPNGEWSDGFWEPSSIGGREKLENYLRSYYGYLPARSDSSYSHFNGYTARICMTLEGIMADEHYPIEAIKSIGNTSEIDDYIHNKLYIAKSDGGLSTALMDWRPLPRPNESVWPYQSIFKDMDEYMDAFKFKKSATAEMKAFVERRLQYLKNVITQSRAKLLIMTGDSEVKLAILERMFPDRKLSVERIPLSGRNKAYTVRIQLPNRLLNVYVLPFFTYLSYENLYRVARGYIIPDYFNKPRPSDLAERAAIADYQPAARKNEPRQSVSKKQPRGNGTEERIYLNKLAEQLSVIEPGIIHSSAHRDNKVDYNYMYFWLKEEPWDKFKCRMEVYVNFTPEISIELNWTLRLDKYDETVQTELAGASKRIGSKLETIGFKTDASARKSIVFHKFVTGQLDEKLLHVTAAELQAAMLMVDQKLRSRA